MTWGLPYLIGRVYFTRLEHLRELAVGIVVGGVVCIPLCWWEMRMSPQLHLQLYGFTSGGYAEMSFGAYRPKLFLSCALELGLWMTATAITGFWLWASGSVKQLNGYALGQLVAWLVVTTILCRADGSGDYPDPGSFLVVGPAEMVRVASARRRVDPRADLLYRDPRFGYLDRRASPLS